MAKQRDYIYYDFTLSLCSKCLKRVFAKIIFEENNVFMLKTCPTHGPEKVLISTDVNYYKLCRDFMKKSEMPVKFNTPVKWGCPYDCGLCTDHEQHSCVSVLEVTDRCNLTCPTCYASSSPTFGNHRTLDEIRFMLDKIVENEGEPDVVQISGGEPTIHPNFFEILDEAKKRPIKHLMLNTNGIKIATEEGFAEKLAKYTPRFEIYLQFDSLDKDALKKIRGVDLTEIRKKAIDKLNKLNLSTNLVVTLQKGVNTSEIGKIIDYAIKQQCIRGITFQPVQVAGRNENFNPEIERYTMSEVRQAILDQCKIFKADDLIPVPCNPDALVMGYALKFDGKIHPLTRYINPRELLDQTRDTITYEYDPEMRKKVIKLFSTNKTCDSAKDDMEGLLCCLPKIKIPTLNYTNMFRIIIMRFMDAYDFDIRAVKKSCVHIVNTEGKIIPFENMNIFYRTKDQRDYLEKLRKEVK